MRTAVTRLTIVAGFIFAATSFAVALPLRIPRAPFLTTGPPNLVQPVPYLPAFFILGIALMFIAAVLYELLPDRTARQDSPEDRWRRSR